MFLESPAAALVSDFDKQRLQDHSTDVARGILSKAHEALAKGDLDAAQDLANRSAAFLSSPAGGMVTPFDRERLQDHTVDVARGMLNRAYSALEDGGLAEPLDLVKRTRSFLESPAGAGLTDQQREELNEQADRIEQATMMHAI